MISNLRDFFLRRKFAKRKRKIQVHNLSTAKSAILLYNYTDERRETEIRDFARFLKEEGVKTSTLAFIQKKIKEEDKIPVEELSYFYFSKEETNWMKVPTSTRLSKLMQTDFDLLIDFNLEGSFPLEWISKLSKASFKVGGDQGYQKEACDLLLGTKEQSIIALQEQCKHYLNMINRKN